MVARNKPDLNVHKCKWDLSVSFYSFVLHRRQYGCGMTWRLVNSVWVSNFFERETYTQWVSYWENKWFSRAEKLFLMEEPFWKSQTWSSISNAVYVCVYYGEWRMAGVATVCLMETWNWRKYLDGIQTSRNPFTQHGKMPRKSTCKPYSQTNPEIIDIICRFSLIDIDIFW